MAGHACVGPICFRRARTYYSPAVEKLGYFLQRLVERKKKKKKELQIFSPVSVKCDPPLRVSANSALFIAPPDSVFWKRLSTRRRVRRTGGYVRQPTAVALR